LHALFISFELSAHHNHPPPLASPTTFPPTGRLFSSWLILGLKSLDPLWVGPGGKYGTLLLSAIAKTVALDQSIRDDSEDGDWSEFLIEDENLLQLRVAASDLLGGPSAPAIRSAVAALKESERSVLAPFGF
jgi:hypothetical protein